MNIYKVLNQMIDYIEKNLENEIDLNELAKIMLVNVNTMQRVFGVICGISLSDYIRKRRLSKAGSTLFETNLNVLEVAQKYKYENGSSFSRAFEKFHGVKPSKVRENTETLKVYPRIKFDEKNIENDNIEYSIVHRDKITLYGICKKTKLETVNQDAPKHFADVLKKYYDNYGMPDYGMTVYENYERRLEVTEYWVLYEKEVNDKCFEKVVIPSSTWLSFKIDSQEAKDIQKVTNDFYKKVLKSLDYKLGKLPELEHYHDDITELLIPIK